MYFGIWYSTKTKRDVVIAGSKIEQGRLVNFRMEENGSYTITPVGYSIYTRTDWWWIKNNLVPVSDKSSNFSEIAKDKQAYYDSKIDELQEMESKRDKAVVCEKNSRKVSVTLADINAKVRVLEEEVRLLTHILSTTPIFLENLNLELTEMREVRTQAIDALEKTGEDFYNRATIEVDSRYL